MLVGACELELFIHSSHSLKEKRFVVKSIKDQVAHRFNVAISETGHLDKWQIAGLGMAAVSNDQKIIQKTFDEIFRLIESNGNAEIVSRTIAFY